VQIAVPETIAIITAHDDTDTITIIPARMASTRLPGKPLADLCGAPMIVRVWQRAMAAETGPVLVAAAENEIVDAIAAAGGEAVLTDPDLPSGSDRIAQALALRDPDRRYRFVINLQGDLPLIEPAAIVRSRDALFGLDADMATLIAEIDDQREIADPNVVKALVGPFDDDGLAMAQDFVRQLPGQALPPYWHHIGIYAYRRDALERFVTLPASVREAERKLEQMRALDNAMTIAAARVDSIPFGVDTPADLERARQVLQGKTG
jgi:3-deoxy-manno-octulosonate cytidylyltransferase (CMP-KDO synthetase)